jgi:hypothetical protein
MCVAGTRSDASGLASQGRRDLEFIADNPYTYVSKAYPALHDELLIETQ